MNACPFCAIMAGEPEAQLTEWFWHSGWIAVVEDLHPKDYDMRLLAMCAEHSPAVGLNEAVVKKVALGIAGALKFTRGLEVVAVDMDNHSYKAHWHLQVCLRKA